MAEIATREQLATWLTENLCEAIAIAALDIVEFREGRTRVPDTAAELAAWSDAYKDFDEQEMKRFIDMCREELSRRGESCS